MPTGGSKTNTLDHLFNTLLMSSPGLKQLCFVTGIISI